MKDELIHNKYRILKTLGQNDFSDTFLATDNRQSFSNRRYIIKKFRPRLGTTRTQEIKRSFHREADILRRLGGSSQIPQLQECFADGEDFYLVREWIEGITLQQRVERQGKLSAVEVEQILTSILQLLKHIHGYGIVYRQLRPSTFVLRQPPRRLKLAGSLQAPDLPVPIYFGNVRELTPQPDPFDYSSVESDRQKYAVSERKQGKRTFASELYSLGLTAIYLLTGKRAAELPRHPRTKQILWHQEVPELKVHLARVLDRAIAPNPARRYSSAAEMLKALHSPQIDLALPPAPKAKTRAASELTVVFWLLAISVGVLGAGLAVWRLKLAGDRNSFVTSWQSDRPIAEELITTNSASAPVSPVRIPPFPLGKSKQVLRETLGKPTMNSKGYWQNSRALLYEDVVPAKIALGYSVDTETAVIRQAEISFASSVDLTTIQLQARQLLQEYYSPEIKKYINRVYFQTSDSHDFQAGDIKGVVQRNPQDHIFIAIWDREFH